MTKSPRIGLVLGGGGARGAFTAGVISYLRYNAVRQIKEFPVISGTSTGALAGSVVCLQQFAKLEKIYTTARAGDIINPNQGLIAETLGVEAAVFASLIFGDNAVFSTDALEQLIAKNVDFDRIAERANRSRLLINTVELQSGDVNVFDSAKHDPATMRKALLASASEPVFMPPVSIGKGAAARQHVDGGVRELVPLSAAFATGVELDLLIVVLTNPVEPEAVDTDYDGMVKILARTVDLALSEVGVADIELARRVNALVKIKENAAALGIDPSLFDGVDPEIMAALDGKRSIPIVTVAPAERLPFDSLDFNTEDMQNMFDLGWDRGVDVIEPVLNAWLT